MAKHREPREHGERRDEAERGRYRRVHRTGTAQQADERRQREQKKDGRRRRRARPPRSACRASTATPTKTPTGRSDVVVYHIVRYPPSVTVDTRSSAPTRPMPATSVMRAALAASRAARGRRRERGPRTRTPHVRRSGRARLEPPAGETNSPVYRSRANPWPGTERRGAREEATRPPEERECRPHSTRRSRPSPARQPPPHRQCANGHAPAAAG